MFRTMADTWWHIVEPTYTGLTDEVVWDAFKAAFKKNFIPDHVWIHKLTKFE